MRQPDLTTVATMQLTDRELEVAKLVASGLTNPQIGARLHLSPRTIEGYLSNALLKTHLSNRTQLALWIHKING